MKILLLSSFLFLGLFTGKKEKLFNGKDLSGWTIHGTEKWYVQDGLLICESGPDKEYGYLSTNKNYKNFILTLKFKQDANGNSGVFFRSQIPEGVKIKGWQAEVAPPGDHTGEERLLTDKYQRFRDVAYMNNVLYAISDNGDLYRISKK